MNVPRPLLVVVVVIIVLGVIACGAGVIRGRIDAASPTATPATRFEGFGNSAVPARDVRIQAFDGGTCSGSGDPVTVSIADKCRFTIDPRSLGPRRLQVSGAGAPYNVLVKQDIRGEERSKDKTFFSDGLVEVSVAGTSPVVVEFRCTSCTMTFPTPAP